MKMTLYGKAYMEDVVSQESTMSNQKSKSDKDHLVCLDISGVYVSIRKIFKFPYDKSYYKTQAELDEINTYITYCNKIGDYDRFLKLVPDSYVAEVDCEPCSTDLEPTIGRHEDGKLISLNVQRLLKSRDKIYKITKMLYWRITHIYLYFRKMDRVYNRFVKVSWYSY
jgi:hypothetical protein